MRGKNMTHERLYSTGTLIRRLREEKGMSMADFEKYGIKRQTVYKYERDIISNISYDVIKIFADALDVNPAYLVGWSNVKKRLPEMGLINDGERNTGDTIKAYISEAEQNIKTNEAEESNYIATAIVGE